MDIIENNVIHAASFSAGSISVSTAQDALDLISAVKFEAGCSAAIIDKSCFSEAFFDLSTGLAGEVLQKFVNYRLRVAIIGDFETVSSSSLRAFIYESNKQGVILFLSSVEKALEIFQSE